MAALVGVLWVLVSGRPAPARAASAPIKVMALGDSITSGTDASATPAIGSYRCSLYPSLILAGYNLTFVGSVNGQWGIQGPPLTPPPSYCNLPDFHEEGHSGYDIPHILTGASSWPGKLQDWATASTPDVVLIHLGTNNFVGNPKFPPPNVDDAINQMSQVIDTLRAANPRVRILLAQILPCMINGVALSMIPDFNNRLPGLAASKARPYSPIVVVDMYTGFVFADHFISENNGLNYVHPNPNGENKMAVRWQNGFNTITQINNWTFVPMAKR